MAHESIFGSAIAGGDHRRKMRGQDVHLSNLSDRDDYAPQFLSINEDPVVVTLTDDERQRFESLRARSNECG